MDQETGMNLFIHKIKYNLELPVWSEIVATPKYIVLSHMTRDHPLCSLCFTFSFIKVTLTIIFQKNTKSSNPSSVVLCSTWTMWDEYLESLGVHTRPSKHQIELRDLVSLNSS